MDPEVVSNFLSEQRENAPEDLLQSFLTIEDFWDRKLWHQLTDVLVEYFNTAASAQQRLPLFRHFILSFAEKINQLKFVSLGLLAATQCSGSLSTLMILFALSLPRHRRPRAPLFPHRPYSQGQQAGLARRLRLRSCRCIRRQITAPRLRKRPKGSRHCRVNPR